MIEIEKRQKAKEFITKLINDNFFKLYKIENDFIATAEKHNLTYALIIETYDIDIDIQTTTDKVHAIIYMKLKTEKESRQVNLSRDEIKNLIKAIRIKKADRMSIYENKIYIEDVHDVLSEIALKQQLNHRRILINYREFEAIKKLFKQQIISINDIKNAYLAFRAISRDDDELFSIHVDFYFAKCHLYICTCIMG